MKFTQLRFAGAVFAAKYLPSEIEKEVTVHNHFLCEFGIVTEGV